MANPTEYELEGTDVYTGKKSLKINGQIVRSINGELIGGYNGVDIVPGYAPPPPVADAD